jgi:hypothetical protein
VDFEGGKGPQRTVLDPHRFNKSLTGEARQAQRMEGRVSMQGRRRARYMRNHNGMLTEETCMPWNVSNKGCPGTALAFQGKNRNGRRNLRG